MIAVISLFIKLFFFFGRMRVTEFVQQLLIQISLLRNNIYIEAFQMRRQAQVLFPQAATYPQFFNHNLTDSNRILKVVSGQHCWARAFYYQLLKIIFQIQNHQQQQPIDYGYLLLTISKQTTQKLPDSPKKQKLKNQTILIQNFLSSQIQNSSQQFQAVINQNLEVDQAMVDILEEIVGQAGYQGLNTSDKIKYLSEVFEVNFNQFDKGIKIQESDTFLYVEGEDVIYIAFLNLISQFQQEEGQQHEGNYQNHQNLFQQQNVITEVVNVSNNQPIQVPIQVTSPNVITVMYQLKQPVWQSQVHQNVTTSLSPFNLQINQQKKQSSPIDYLLTNKFRSNNNNNNHQMIKIQQAADSSIKAAENINQAQSIQKIKNQSYQENNLQFTLGKNKLEQSQHTLKMLNSAHMKRAETFQESRNSQFTLKNRESIAEKRVPSRNQIYTKNSNNQEELFYKPANVKVAANKNSLSSNDSRTTKKDPLDICNDSQKGTFYRKFTDTRILNLLAEPYRTKVKMLKNRFIGVHSRNHRPPVYGDKIK